MNLALIIAGGKGVRMHGAVPKQFMDVCGRPVIIHTLGAFQDNKNIDVICVVCLVGWKRWLQNAAKKYHITKLKHIACGGSTGQESIWNGLNLLAEYYPMDSVVLIHDAVRPMVTNELIDNCIRGVNVYGNAVTAIGGYDALMETSEGVVSDGFISRETVRRVQAPQGFKLEQIVWAHKEARKRNIKNSLTSCTLMATLGQKVFFVPGSEKNLKLTSPEDTEIFRALIKKRNA